LIIDNYGISFGNDLKMSPLATPKFSIVNFQLSIGSHRLPDKRELETVSISIAAGDFSPAANRFYVLIFCGNCFII